MNTTKCNKLNLIPEQNLKDACVELCGKLTQQVGQAKHNLLAEFRGIFKTQEHLLHLAVTEADALAWQTDYPHLLFPELATEKIRRAADWNRRQQFVWWRTSAYPLAA